MLLTGRMLFALCGLCAAAAAMRYAAPPPTSDTDWKETLRKTHARFTGHAGTFAHFGDSITVTQAFWSPLPQARKNASPEMEKAFQTVQSYMRPECWSDWKGPEFGSEGGQTVQWAQENVVSWMRRMNPEVALIMFGSNDMSSVDAAAYRERLRDVAQKCLSNGTFVILSTVPPRHGYEKQAAAFAEAAREVARELKLPLTDFHAEILKRRPKDWDGALDTFAAYKDYDVPTLLARDGVHPSYPVRYQNDYSKEALERCGYGLRSYLVLMQYAEVVRAIQAAPKQAEEKKTKASLAPPEKPWFPKAPPLPPARGEAVRVMNAEQLYSAVEGARPGRTILLADGLYPLPRPLDIKTDGVTLRSESAQRRNVILDGGNEGELVRLTACSDVTIADLTVQNVRWNGIKLNSETNVQRARIYNCILHNIWQRAVKGVLVPKEDRERIRPTGCRVEYCLFYNDHAKQFSDDSADTAQTFNGNYIGGIDVMYPRDWVISDNVFVGIQGRTREARGAIFLWHDAMGCVVERNIILDCDTGIALGNASRNAETTTHCTRCLVRNNFVTRAPEGGIAAIYTQDCKIFHNTIVEPDSRLGRLIRLVYANDGLQVANNLLCGAKIKVESESQIQYLNNLEEDISATLAVPNEGNLRLTKRSAAALDKAKPSADVTDDIDRSPRDSAPDIGAHELRR